MNAIHLDSVDSTNKYIKENSEKLENFTFVSTSNQTAGKGREDRNWLSNKGENLLFSFIIKDPKLLKKYKAISLGTASLIARFLELLGIENVLIKWPNDVFVGDKKICGILLEGNVKNYLVVGVGLNVNQTIFEGEYRTNPTSIKAELKIAQNLVEIEVDLFEFLYKHLNQRLFTHKTFEYIKNHNYLFSKKIRINNIEGNVDAIDKDFNLIVDGKKIDTGEVQILK